MPVPLLGAAVDEPVSVALVQRDGRTGTVGMVLGMNDVRREALTV